MYLFSVLLSYIKLSTLIINTNLNEAKKLRCQVNLWTKEKEFINTSIDLKLKYLS